MESKSIKVINLDICLRHRQQIVCRACPASGQDAQKDENAREWKREGSYSRMLSQANSQRILSFLWRGYAWIKGRFSLGDSRQTPSFLFIANRCLPWSACRPCSLVCHKECPVRSCPWSWRLKASRSNPKPRSRCSLSQAMFPGVSLR